MTAQPEQPGTGPATLTTPWLFDGEPGDGDFLLFGFHYAGTGAASTYNSWPRRIGAGLLCPLQPPGRESRIQEEPSGSHLAFAEDLAGALSPHLDRPYGFVGHCGAFPYLLETAFALARNGAPPPLRLFASSWGPPHHGPYGRLNLVDLDQLDLMAEIQNISLARLGVTLTPDMAEFAAETLLVDLLLQRTHSYSGHPRVPCRTIVVSWGDDAVVPPELTERGDWAECADVSFHRIDGDHWEFMRCPRELQDLIATEMASAAGFA
jgi:surfactin synthase thioesterase subunit